MIPSNAHISSTFVLNNSKLAVMFGQTYTFVYWNTIAFNFVQNKILAASPNYSAFWYVIPYSVSVKLYACRNIRFSCQISLFKFGILFFNKFFVLVYKIN